MTDKQIIIDGCDVSGCEHYTGNIGYLTDKNWTCRARIQGTKCEDWSDCYFKRWKRKEQEYERLSSLIRKTQTYKNTCCDCRDEILLYPSISGRTNYTQIEVEEISLERIIQQLNQLKAKNEELKSKLNGWDEVYKSVNEIAYVISLKKNKYQQALTEIKEIAYIINDRTMVADYICDHLDKILQKCEVLDETSKT